MRITYRIMTVFLSIVLLLGAVPALATDEEDTPSSWAAEEFARALGLDFVPTRLRGDYRAPITRAEFAELAVRFLQNQFNANPNVGYFSNEFIDDYCERHVNPDGSKLRKEDYANGEQGGAPFDWQTGIRSAVFFSDVPRQYEYCNYAYAFGIVTGRGDGIFDPDGAITRQEAAAMLMRAYTCYAGVTAEEPGGLPPFPDAGSIADWAQDSVRLLNLWGVMEGTEDGSFRPGDTYTREQSVVTFLRLYENAPVGQAKGNVTPLVPYDEELERQLANDLWGQGLGNEYFDEGETCAVLVWYCGADVYTLKNSRLTVVYRTGGYRWAAAPLSGAATGGHFNEDETVYFVEARHADGYVETLPIELVRGVFLEPEVVRESVQNPAGIIAERVSAPAAVLVAAKEYVKRQYAEWCEHTTGYGWPAAYDDWRIEGLERVYSYRELNGQALSEFGVSGQSIDVYRLDYRIHTLTPGLITLAGGMKLDAEGWHLPTYPNSTYLYFAVTDGEPDYLFMQMENDCSPGNALFTSDLINRLREMEKQGD